jgi:hypothetical protein
LFSQFVCIYSFECSSISTVTNEPQDSSPVTRTI